MKSPTHVALLAAAILAQLCVPSAASTHAEEKRAAAKADASAGRNHPAATPTTSDACIRHTVGEGQSLWKISRRYHVSPQEIEAHNGLRPGEPIQPGQRLEIPKKPNGCGRTRRAAVSTPSAAPPTSASAPQPPELPPSSAVAKPAPSTQVQKSAAERGVNPCNTPDPGFGIYDPWSRAPSMGQMISPQQGGVTPSGRFDVMFHFHGHEAVRKEWVQVMDGAVLVGIDLGIGSGPYGDAFRSPDAFEKLVQSVERAVADKTGKKDARVRNVGLSAWSAGYGAVAEILNQSYGKRMVDVVVLLDGLHSGYAGASLDPTQLAPFVSFAREAAAGRKFLFVSHSSIIPPGYASTTETASFLIQSVGGRATQTKPRSSDPMGLELVSRFTRRGFHVRGYAGNDKMDHCAHIGLLRDILKVHIKPRWRSPRGRRVR